LAATQASAKLVAKASDRDGFMTLQSIEGAGPSAARANAGNPEAPAPYTRASPKT
jgi:hypothetical protein